MGKILGNLKSPHQLREMPLSELEALACEIRTLIVEVVEKNGGHLGSNLGVVELAIALHRVFDFDKDRVIWDVSHQSYAHKLLTGRYPQFHTLRTRGGLSGYADPRESVYDAFFAGHAGTSVSTGLGMVCGDDIAGRSRRVVAVIGDGAMTAGMAFEALNHCGSLGKDLIVVLNDNEMSISRTVGAMAEYLSRLRAAPIYQDFKKEVHSILSRIPKVGERMERLLEHLKDVVKSAAPGRIFEDLGFQYFGPLDGHNLKQLIDTFGKIKRIRGPILVHLLTTKGKGCEHALADPTRLHGVGPSRKKDDGKVRKELTALGKLAYTDVFADKIVEIARKNPRVVAITAAMPDGTGLVKFRDALPQRYFDVGITEQHAIGLAAGLSKAGLMPVAAIYSTFLQRAFDQVFHEISLQNLGVVISMDRGGVVGEDGPTHHGVFDIAYLRVFPNAILMAPKDGAELGDMLEYAVELGRFVAIRYPRDHVPDQVVIPSTPPPLRLAMPEVLRNGRDGAIIAYGATVYPALDAAAELGKEGIHVSVVNARFAKPLNSEFFLDLAASQAFLLTIEDHVLAGGFGSAVMETLADHRGNVDKVHRLGIPDSFVEHASRAELLEMLGLDSHGIAGRVRDILRIRQRVREE